MKILPVSFYCEKYWFASAYRLSADIFIWEYCSFDKRLWREILNIDRQDIWRNWRCMLSKVSKYIEIRIHPPTQSYMCIYIYICRFAIVYFSLIHEIFIFMFLFSMLSASLTNDMTKGWWGNGALSGHKGHSLTLKGKKKIARTQVYPFYLL